MIRYSPAQLAQLPVVQHRAEQTRNLVETVFETIQSKDGFAADQNPVFGAVSIREDGFEFSGSGSSLRKGPFSQFKNELLSSDPAIGKCVAKIEGDEVIGAVRVIGADLSPPTNQGSIGEGLALAYDIFSLGGWGGVYKYSVENTRNGSRLTVDQGGSQRRVEIDARGQLVEFSEGTPTFFSRLRDKFS